MVYFESLLFSASVWAQPVLYSFLSLNGAQSLAQRGQEQCLLNRPELWPSTHNTLRVGSDITEKVEAVLDTHFLPLRFLPSMYIQGTETKHDNAFDSRAS